MRNLEEGNAGQVRGDRQGEPGQVRYLAGGMPPGLFFPFFLPSFSVVVVMMIMMIEIKYQKKKKKSTRPKKETYKSWGCSWLRFATCSQVVLLGLTIFFWWCLVGCSENAVCLADC